MLTNTFIATSQWLFINVSLHTNSPRYSTHFLHRSKSLLAMLHSVLCSRLLFRLRDAHNNFPLKGSVSLPWKVATQPVKSNSSRWESDGSNMTSTIYSTTDCWSDCFINVIASWWFAFIHVMLKQYNLRSFSISIPILKSLTTTVEFLRRFQLIDQPDGDCSYSTKLALIFWDGQGITILNRLETEL